MFNTNLLSGLVIVAFLVAMSACDQTKNYTDQEHLQRAKEFQGNGKPDSAIIELRNALQKNPKNADARLLLGEMYIRQGSGEAAESELNKAKDLGIDPEALVVPMGEALLLQQLYPRVLAEIRIGPKTPPESVPRILEMQGRAHLALSHFQEGCPLFAQSLEKNPQYVPAYWGLARCAAASGKIDDARTQLEKAIKVDAKNSVTWTRIGDLERATKRFPEAESAYARALEYNNSNFDALLGRAILRIGSNKLDAATQDIDAAARIAGKHPFVSQLRGVVQYKQGNFPAAEASFRTVLASQPTYLPAVLWLGFTNFAERNYEQAAAQFAQYTRSIPSVRIKALLGLAQARLGRGDAAEETLKVLRDVNVKDPQSLTALAEAYSLIGDADLATAYMAKAVDQEPDAANLRLGLASTLEKTGKRTQAIAQLESAIKLDPALVDADAMLIQNLVREKQFERALLAAESLEKKQPKDPRTFNLKGTVYLAMNDFANARKSFEQALAVDASSTTAVMHLAQLDLIEKNPQSARQRFQTVLGKDPKNIQAMMGVAGIAAAAGQDAEYVAWLEKAAQAAPSETGPRVLLVNYYLRKNDAQKALAIAREVQTADPRSPLAIDLLGTAQLAAGEKENAVATFSNLAKIAPKNPVVHYKLAAAQIAAQKIDSAKVSLNRALALKPDFLEAEIMLGSAELGMARYAQAMKIAQQIQKRHPQATAGFVLQGDALMAQQQFAAAGKAYEKASAINSGSGLLAIKMHESLSAGGNPKEAEARLTRWLNDHPSDVPARAYLAATYMRHAQNRQAIEQYQVLLQHDAKNVVALNNLAWLYQQEKDPRALATAEQVYALRPDSADVMDTFGWILVQQGDVARGLSLLKSASEKASTSTGIRYHWAAALAKSGDREAARRALADLLTNNKNFPQRQDAEQLFRQL